MKMMNKLRIVVLFFLSTGLCADVFAQAKAAKPAAGGADDKFIISALTALKANNLEEARTQIDKAFTPETKDKAKALFAKAEIYISLYQQSKASALYQDAAKALFKLLEMKPDYEKATVDQLLFYVGFCYFNDGVKAYNDHKFGESIEIMKNVIKVRDISDGAKKFEKLTMVKQFDTICANATLSMANSAYTLQKYDEAISLLVSAKNNPITKSAAVYECLVDAYNHQKNAKDVSGVIQEARTTYPDDLIIRNQELNYFLQSGKYDELVKKLESAAVKEPNNSEILSNLAFAYLTLASGKDGKRPANAAELLSKSEDAFKNALRLSPENGSSNYNFGALYFNQGIDMNEQMNAIAAATTPDQRKYEDLKAKRDALFTKSVPYMEKAYTVFSGNEANLRGDDQVNYKGTVSALAKVYADQNKADNADQMKKKYDTLK